MTRTRGWLAALPALLGACTTVAAVEPDEFPTREPAGECDASGVQTMIGQRASAELGATLLQRTGAATLRWVPPGTAVTMDFNPSRLTVSYAADYRIDRISCG